MTYLAVHPFALGFHSEKEDWKAERKYGSS